MTVVSSLMKRSPLAAFHRRLGATMETESGWRVSIDCGDAVGEARALREGSILVDWSHIGKILVRGSKAAEGLSVIEPRVESLECQEAIERPDLAILRLASDEFLLLTPAGVESECLRTLEKAQCVATDVTGGTGALALAGPRRFEVVERSAASDLSCHGLRAGHVMQTSVHATRCTVLRTDHFDLYLQQRDLTEHLAAAFLDIGRRVGLVPAGVSTLPIEWAKSSG